MREKLLRLLVKPSTRGFWQEARRRPGGTVREALHGLFYLTWPEFYISVGLGRGRLARLLREQLSLVGRFFGLWTDDAGLRFADTYHGKAMPLPEMTRLIRIGRPVRAHLPETVLPYSRARDIILENPKALALFRCPCRATVSEPCLPLDVCIIVGRPIVDFVLEHHPGKARRVTVGEAVEVVRASQMRGHVSHAFFKEAVLGRYYAVCNCCSCCCGAMQAYRMGTPMLASSGYVAVSDRDSCIGCGVCAKICPFAAIDMVEGGIVSSGLPGETPGKSKGTKVPRIRTDACLGCGICALHCHARALRLARDESKPEPLLEQINFKTQHSA